MKPEQIAKDSESSHQTALFCWAALEAKAGREDLAWLYHVPNGGSRGDDPKSRQIAGGRIKAEGARSGVPDIGLDVARRGFHGLRIEMKRPAEKDNKGKDLWKGCSDNQKKWLDRLQKQGYCVGVCYSWEEARDAINWYLEGEMS